MMRLIGWAVLIIAILLLGGVFAKMMLADSGVMMVTWNGWLIETTFWAGTGLILLSFVTLLIIIQLWRGYAPTRLWQRFRQHRNQKAAKKETIQAVNAWLSGQDDKAVQSLQRVANAGGSDRLPRAMTLALGWHQGDWLERQAELVQRDPELKSFANAIAAQRLWLLNEPAQFMAHMQQHEHLKQVPWLRQHYWQALLSQGQADTLLDQVLTAANLHPDERSQWVEKAAITALKSSIGSAERGRAVLKKLPKAIRALPAILAVELSFLVSINEHEQAFKKVQSALKQGMPEPLLSVIHTIGVEPSKKLTLLEQYEPAQPSALYCRVAGQLNLASQLWGQAQSWLEKGWAQQDTQSGVLLADLFEQRKMPEQASKLYKQLALTNPIIKVEQY